MPEPVELLVRGGERRRMRVAEADDGDPAGEVEVAAAVGVRPATEPSPSTSVTSARA